MYVCMCLNNLTIVNRIHNFESHIVQLGCGCVLGSNGHEIVVTDFVFHLFAHITFELVKIFFRQLKKKRVFN